MSGPLSSARPLFEGKIGVASWVRRGRRPRPAAGLKGLIGISRDQIKKRTKIDAKIAKNADK
jgi:hypothetical protein